LPQFLKADISIPLASLFKLKYGATEVIKELNKMSMLSIFKKEQCLRLLDTLTDYTISTGVPPGAERDILDTFFEKLML